MNTPRKKGQREKMGAASSRHPHPLTEMLNLLSASPSLVAGTPDLYADGECNSLQAASFTHSLIQGRAYAPEQLHRLTVSRIIYENNRTIRERL